MRAYTSLGKFVSRADMGLPRDWSRIQDWLSFNCPVRVPDESLSGLAELKWKDIPILEDYWKIPGAFFWEKFLKRDLPVVPETKIDTGKLEGKVSELSEKLSTFQFERARRAINFLKYGALAFQKKSLPGCFVNNSSIT